MTPSVTSPSKDATTLLLPYSASLLALSRCPLHWNRRPLVRGCHGQNQGERIVTAAADAAAARKEGRKEGRPAAALP
eukprot:CAMPEP_0206491424 /NCGR_PEP_ID=MMETSP0324_2-20121206/44988_1 /ASSEMBLY_ACC=CAM_ASM_000836 /TAXON_ID=2866 /ORGANISM="Crypthecodinium cohnii, Strain Seligo" /LENGTH=76 /DNA_ID=CAMNT_0053972613 /DNA_START=192 /DNA_END=418 /DNA_ORIENTATION=+